jgi:hypothetical protein
MAFAMVFRITTGSIVNRGMPRTEIEKGLSTGAAASGWHVLAKDPTETVVNESK